MYLSAGFKKPKKKTVFFCLNQFFRFFGFFFEKSKKSLYFWFNKPGFLWFKPGFLWFKPGFFMV
jgi:hypothetical protein